MGLSLATPLALLLGALIALPILAHMARQTPRDRQPFGAMLLMERVIKRLRRRRRVKDLLLLLLRVLAVLAVIAAVAGPQFTYQGDVPEFGGSGRVVLIVDRSMSMQLQDGGSTLLQRAREQAVELLRGLPEGAMVGLVVFDREAIRLTPELTRDREGVITKLQGLQPTHGTSNLRGGLLEARRLLAGEPGEVVLFSDEAGPRTVEEAAGELQRLIEGGSAVIPRVVRGDPPRNVAVSAATYGEGLEGGQVTLRVANYGPDPVELPCEVVLPDGATIDVFVDLPPEGEAEQRITVPREALGGVGHARCKDPDLPADDVRYFHLPRVGASRVLVVDGDPGDTPTRSEVYFLERALAPWGAQTAGVAIDVTTPVGLMELDADRHRVVFLANVSDPRPFGPRLTEFVRKGGNLILTGGDNVTADRYNAALGTVLPSPLRQPRPVADQDEEGIPVALPDTSHELFAPFRRAGRGGFSRVRSHTVLTLEPFAESDEVSTLLSYENGMPALVIRQVGAGRVVLWTGTFDHGWGNLPLQSVFMPMIQRLVSWLGGESGGDAARLHGQVGERLTLPLPDLSMEPKVVRSDGVEQRSRIEGSHLIFTPDAPGAYRIAVDDAAPLAWVAVNLDPLESDVRVRTSVAAVERQIAPELLDRQVDLARPALALGMIFLVLQGLIGLRGGQS